jgi:hypothetical protein
MIKHTESIDQEAPGGRAKKVGGLYIESAEGERFKYPYKHLTGARAMARHVAEGGNAYDDFGKHIVSMSEEMNKLRKFKTYMGRSAVMAESLSEYMDVVKERIATVKKTLESLQRPAYYKEAFEGFEVAVMEDVPADVAENWIDQLTIRQFNEELADVFPYIYKLVSEATKAEELTAEDLMNEKDPCWKGYKQIGMKKKGKKEVPNCVPEEIELEAAFEESMGQFSEAANDCDETCPKSCPDCGGTGDPEKYKEMQKEAEECKDCGCSPCECDDDTDEGNAYAHAVRKAKMDGKKKGDKVQGPDGDEITIEKDEKTPLGEFILSYYDREAGEFPKGETAVLTMIEKDYGEQYINPAKEFIERVYELTDQHRMKEGRPDDGGLGVVEKLLQGITKDFVDGDDSAAQKMVDMLKKYNAPMDKVADMLEQKAKELTKKTFGIFDNPLKKTPAGDAADRMTILADYIRSKAGQSEEFDRMRELAGLR